MDKTSTTDNRGVAVWADAELGMPPVGEGLPLTLYEVINRMQRQGLDREADWILDYMTKFWQEIA